MAVAALEPGAGLALEAAEREQAREEAVGPVAVAWRAPTRLIRVAYDAIILV